MPIVLLSSRNESDTTDVLYHHNSDISIASIHSYLFALINCLNSFLFTNFLFPMYKTKLHIELRSSSAILLIPIFEYSAASFIVRLIFFSIGTYTFSVINRFIHYDPLISQSRHPFADFFPDAVLIILTVVSSYGKSV